MVLAVKAELEKLEGVVYQHTVMHNMVEGLMALHHPHLPTVKMGTVVLFTYLNILVVNTVAHKLYI